MSIDSRLPRHDAPAAAGIDLASEQPMSSSSGAHSQIALVAPRMVSPKRGTPTARGAAWLTPTEQVVLAMADLTNKEISYQLGCSQWTVKSHMRHINRSLGVANRRAAVTVWRLLQLEAERDAAPVQADRLAA